MVIFSVGYLGPTQFDQFSEFIEHVIAQKFLEKEHRDIVLIDDNPHKLIKKFESYQPPRIDKAAWALRMNKGR